MTVPTMRMGLIGFADEQYLRNLLMTRNRNLQWERWPFMEADALWINGAHAQPLRNHMVRVPSVEPSKKATVLNLKEMDRPAAFTLPFGNGYFNPPVSFDPRKVDQVAEVLNLFEAAVMPTAVELTLAAEIANRRHDLSAPTYHLSLHGRLIGVVNVSGDIGLDPHTSPFALSQADWAGRPESARDVPSHFRHTSIALVMWQYAMRSAVDLLPSRYRDGTIYYRRLPSVPRSMVREEHLLLIAELSTGPKTVRSLVAATGLSESVVTQGLAALYFGGSLTTDPRKAGPVREVKPRSAEEAWPSSMTSTFSAPEHVVPPRPGRARGEFPTVPTPLDEDK